MTEDTGSGEARLRDLAERLMTHPQPEGEITARLFVGELPDGLGIDMPMPDGGVLVGSQLRRLAGRPAIMEVVLDVDGEPSAILDAYEGVAATLGWIPFSGFGPPHGGFVSAGVGDGRMLRRDSDGPLLMTSAMAREDAPTDVRLRLDWESFRHVRNHPRGIPLGAELLPTLRAPAGATMRRTSSGGGDDEWHSEATVQTDRSVVELENHFSTQLAGAGWAKSGGGGDGTMAWSSWALPPPEDWRGVMLVLAPFEPTEQFVLVQIERAATEEPSGSSYTPVWR